MLDYLHSLLSLSGIVNGIIGSILALIVVAALVYVWKSLRKFVSSSAEANRKFAIANIKKRVRSDEYYADRQKVEIHALVITIGALVTIPSLLGPFEAGDRYASIVLLIALLLILGGLLFHLETRYNNAALKIRMALEKRRRSKRMRERREGADATYRK